jgi:hypothetical protein
VGGNDAKQLDPGGSATSPDASHEPVDPGEGGVIEMDLGAQLDPRVLTGPTNSDLIEPPVRLGWSEVGEQVAGGGIPGSTGIEVGLVHRPDAKHFNKAV